MKIKVILILLTFSCLTGFGQQAPEKVKPATGSKTRTVSADKKSLKAPKKSTVKALGPKGK